jgi:hypothetical protein
MLFSANLNNPSRRFIGPNRDGDPTNVQLAASYTYWQLNAVDSGTTYQAEFQNTVVPEPSSIVMAASGLLLLSEFTFGRTLYAVRGRAL